MIEVEFDINDYTIMRDQIQKWLADDGMFKKTVMDENTNFHFIINFPEGHIMDLVQPKGMNDRIIIGCMTQVSPQHTNAMEKLKNEDFDEMKTFSYEFRSAINQFNVDMEIGEANNILVHYVVQDMIYSDGLTKNNLMNVIKKIFRAKLQGLWMINHKFGEFDGSVINENSNKPSQDTMYV